MRKPLKYRDLRKRLRRFGIRENETAGKGSERMFVGYVDGRLVTYPTKCHGEGQEKPIPVIEAIRRHFHLTAQHGVTDNQFYQGKK
jgi:hypothetical protein